MKKTLIAIIFIQFSCLYVVSAQLNELIRDAVAKNLNATENEDYDAILQTLHPNSLILDRSRNHYQNLFTVYDLKYEIKSFDFIGLNGEYALARVIWSTKKVSGPEFNDNQIDSVMVFRMDGETWKLWSQAILEIKYE